VRSDFELLDRWREGDREAGSELFERHFVPLFRFFRNKVSESVHDLVQDTLLACVEARDDFRRESGFRTFLFGVARRVLFKYLRKHYAAGREIDFGSASVADLGTTPSQLATRKVEHRLLLEALRTLPLDHQIALELAYWEGLGGPEIAAVLDVPANTARTRLRRAREALSERLRELESSPERVRSTLDDLDRWASSLREYIDADGRG
jgi:RNA polymerase sigma-70 factor (ECF subfamily)